MQPYLSHTIFDNDFTLSPQRCMYWEQQQTLVLSDLHLGKSGHFRKSGIAVPQSVFKEDLQRLVTLLQQFKPEKVLVIGDLFHSRDNKEHLLFLKWRKDFSQLHFQLVMGNHDILLTEWYNEAGIELIEHSFTEGSFCFVHDIAEADLKTTAEKYFFSGHIHPGISISGMGKQNIHLPCFYFGKKYAVLPAFGKFTGTFPVKPKRGETVFAILPAQPAASKPAGLLKVF